MSSRHRAKPIATQVQVLLLRFGHGITTFLEPDIGIVMTNGGSVRRAEVENGEIFYSLREAQILIEEWRKHYNTKPPHSALGYRPPAPETIVQMDQRPIMH